MAITVTRPPPPARLGKYAKYSLLYRTVQHDFPLWSAELCVSVPRTVFALLIETAKTSRLSSLLIAFRLAFFSIL